MKKCLKFIKGSRQAVVTTLVLMLICGLGFPLLLNGLSALLFPSQAAGDLIMVDGAPIGSVHVGQQFTEPYFMKGRPSAVGYNTYEEGSDFSGPASGSNNYGPSNPALTERIEQDIEAFLAANPGVERSQIPADLITASGSGLDPHISPESAAIQIPAIARASGLTEAQLEQIVSDHTQGKLLGLFGEETVNVLLVNLDIARAMGLV